MTKKSPAIQRGVGNWILISGNRLAGGGGKVMKTNIGIFAFFTDRIFGIFQKKEGSFNAAGFKETKKRYNFIGD